MGARYKADIITEELDDVLIVFDPEDNEFHEFNGVARIIWTLLVAHTPQEITEKICAVYEIDMAEARRDVVNFTEELLRLGLVLTGEA